jgi:hypothetical protein
MIERPHAKAIDATPDTQPASGLGRHRVITMMEVKANGDELDAPSGLANPATLGHS